MKTTHPLPVNLIFPLIIFLSVLAIGILFFPEAKQVLDQLNLFISDAIGSCKYELSRAYGL